VPSLMKTHDSGECVLYALAGVVGQKGDRPECHSDKPDSFHVAAAAGRPKCNESGEKPGKKAEKRVVRFTRAARWRDRETWNARRVSLIRMPFGTGVNATGLAAHAAYKTPRCPGQEPEPDAQV